MTKIKLLISTLLFLTAVLISACNTDKTEKDPKIKSSPPKNNSTVIHKNKTKNDKKPPLLIPAKLLPLQKKTQQDPIVISVPEESKIATKMNVPKKWTDAFAAKEWQEYYHESSTAFINGWKKELQKDTFFIVTKDDLLRIYRGKMEKIFYASPEFIEYSVQKLKSEHQIEILEKNFPSRFN